ncbi:MAG: TraB/GumN family protein [Bacteroidaceae bacterium]|nr:TraB/GumN family protein [Bacteroidaceae bacterium]
MKSLVTALLFMAAITSNAQFIYRVSGNGLKKPSYILGTIHLLPGSLLDSIPAYLKAEARCRQMYVETDVTNKQQIQELRTTGLQAMAMPDGKTIFDILSEDQTELLSRTYQEVMHVNLADSASRSLWTIVPKGHIQFFETFFQAMAILQHPQLRMTGTPMDGVCMERAKERGMPLGQLDEKPSQDKLDKLHDEWVQDIDAQVDSLVSYLNHIDEHRTSAVKGIEYAAQGIEDWKKGDYDHFDAISLEEVQKQPSVFRERNEKWLPKIQTAMREMPTMFVFGAGHLVGPHGVLQLLRDAGYKIKPVKK